ncbi:hypothetical protein H4S03_002769, partial [Coemansia sp. S3946]
MSTTEYVQLYDAENIIDPIDFKPSTHPNIGSVIKLIRARYASENGIEDMETISAQVFNGMPNEMRSNVFADN